MPDKDNIDLIITSFFNIFNNTDQTQPDWELIYNICIPQTVIIKKTGLAEEAYDLKSFIEPRKKILSDGTLTEFEERETEEETRIVGNIAQRYSKYVKNGNLNGNHFEGGGNKFFQLIKTTGGWKISAVLWEDNA